MKKSLRIFGVATMFLFSVLLFLTFLEAYLSPAKTARVFINFFGEADIELAIITAIMLLQAAVFVTLMREFKERK